MFHPRLLALLLTLAPLLLVGCETGSSTTEPRYRTVTAEPRRNTDLARRLNEQGLEHLEAGRLDQAADHFQRALTADVEFGPAHNNLGRVYFERQRWYEAALEFDAAAKAMPKRPEPRNNLGLVLEQAGELDRAVAHYREAVGLAPKSIEYRANLARALLRRGDRTDEVRTLLRQIVDEDRRPDWIVWARQQLTALDNPGNPRG